MSQRCVVNVATGCFVKGQKRLDAALVQQDIPLLRWADRLPDGCPEHHDVPYAFKAFALARAEEHGFDLLLWADASILPIRPLAPLFERIEREGYWISRNGWRNSEWTADAAYADLGISREENAQVPHVTAGSFGVSLAHPLGKQIFEEYVRLAKTRAFCGPWKNSRHPKYAGHADARPCGDASVLGHRHDQTALSVVAWRAGVKLTDPPNILAYKGGETEDTMLVMDGSY